MRLIDVDEALRLFDEEYKETNELIHNGETHLDNLAEGFAEAYHIIKYDLPTVDAVEVVRCKDCKYSCKDGNGRSCEGYWYELSEYDVTVKDDDFCSYGEGKDYDQRQRRKNKVSKRSTPGYAHGQGTDGFAPLVGYHGSVEALRGGCFEIRGA